MKLKKLTVILLVLSLMITNVQITLADTIQYKTVAEAGTTAREQMVKRASQFTVYVKSKNINAQAVYDEIEAEIFKDTADSDEGDYLKWNMDNRDIEYKCSEQNGYYCYDFTINVTYLTTAEQNAQVNEKVKSIIDSFKFTSTTSEYTKIKTIYDYVCKNVSYAKDVNDPDMHTAWAALIKGEAVCQGYVQLIYKMLKEVGVSNRIIAGYSRNEEHGWNIVMIGNYYYNIDATWDATYAQSGQAYKYFLKCNDGFEGHVRMPEYNTAEFNKVYVMATNNYEAKVNNQTSEEASKRAAFSAIKPKIKKLTRKKIKLTKVPGAEKYQIKYSTKKKFKKSKTITTKKLQYKFIKLKKKLKENKKYYVKYRAYCTIDGKRVYTKWSKTKEIKKVKKK